MCNNDTFEKYKKALQKIASFEENKEDYYGGVSIDYHAMVISMIKIAQEALKKD